METLSQQANTFSLTASRENKYSTEQLAEIEALFESFDVSKLYAEKM